MVFIVARIFDNLTRPAPAWGVRDFARREDGSLTILGLLIFILMMTAAGIALDVMRSEVRRAELQYAVDRAVLAAADIEQTRSAEEIVKDYIRAAGLDEDSVEVTVTPAPLGSGQSVTVETLSETDSLFLNLLGVDVLQQPAFSQAQELRTELELSLVLDISGSMGGAKIATLRTAASDFVAELLRGREDLTSISLVPYNDRVNAGTAINSVFDTSDEHPFSNCFVFDDAAYGRLDMRAGDELQRMGHFDFRTTSASGNAPGLVSQPNCRTDDYAAILPWSNDVETLQARIGKLQAGHWTAMDLGVKWGTLLLDPSSQDELLELASLPDASGGPRVDSVFAGRPKSYDHEDTHKVLVVMTDGVNTQQWDVLEDRREGPSGIYVYREPMTDVCESYQRDRYSWFGRRIDGLSWTDAAHCDDWDDAGRPEPFENASSGPVLEVSIDDLEITLGEAETATTDISVNLFDRDIPVNRFGSDGSACDVGTPEQQALCRANFDDDEGHRYLPRYSVWSPNVQAYWISHRRQYWRDGPYGGAQAIQLDWTELLGSLSISYIYNVLMNGATWNDRIDYFYSFETTHQQARADKNLSRICEEARDNGVVVYTIAFQAPDDGRAAMLDCAGDDNENRYFNVNDFDISAAFDDVLVSVSRLRLTQ